jgi:glycosyltransferase involved in cell wall biosynthesis
MMKTIFINRGYPESHLKVIYNGAPVERYRLINDTHVQQLRKQFDLSADDIVIGCVSRKKKQEQLIHALQYLDSSYKVLFVGIEKGSLDNLARQLGIKQTIHYAGIVGNNDALAYYKLMNVNVLPSTTDGFGLVLIEAMACGVPVVGTNFGGITDVIQHESSGLLYTDDNYRELALCIERCISDTSFREKCIKNGYKRAFEDFSIERTIDNYETFFKQLIEIENNQTSITNY